MINLILGQSLAQHYDAVHLSKGSPKDALDRFKMNIDRINGLREAAQAKLKELQALETATGGELEKRCAISAHQLSCLRQALS